MKGNIHPYAPVPARPVARGFMFSDFSIRPILLNTIAVSQFVVFLGYTFEGVAYEDGEDRKARRD